MADRHSITGIHHFPSARMALVASAARIEELVAERYGSSRPPPRPEDLETLDVDPDSDPEPPLAA